MFSLITLSASSQVSIGIGIVWIEFDGPATIEFYRTPEDNTYSKRLVIFNDPVIDGLNLKDYPKHKKWLQPEVMRLDYYHFNFRCKSETEKWLEVIVNNEDGSTLWVKRSEQTKFQPWKEYLMSMFGIKRLNARAQGIYDAADESSKKVASQGKDCFRIKEMRGDWVEIFSSDECDTKKRTEIKSAWIKWKEGDKILIEYSTTS
ncbi:hypothetical protein BH09BAC3_BH09BAC3_16820 [soil metagenome]